MSGRHKGSRAEREVAALLEGWWGAVEPGCRFVRTPLSGGWNEAKVRGSFRCSGDIMTTAQRFPFVVEVKRREGWAPKNFLEGNASPVWGWWEQTIREAVEVDGVPMLWLRKNAERAAKVGGKFVGSAKPVWWVVVPLQIVGTLWLPAPDFVWSKDILDRVQVLPVGYVAGRLLEIDPERVALP
jgi:hypothetical protein